MRKNTFGGGDTERTDLPVGHSSENVPQDARDLAWYSECPGRWLEPRGLEVQGTREGLGEGEICPSPWRAALGSNGKGDICEWLYTL